MMKKILLVIALILLFGNVFAYENPLTSFGFLGLDNNTNSTPLCKELTINIPDTALAEKGAGILSLNTNFLEDVNDSTYVSVSINGGEEKKYWHESFSCKATLPPGCNSYEMNPLYGPCAEQQCWTRVFIPEIKQGPTKINICAVLGGASKELEVTQNSFIGIYDTPVLSITNSAPQSIYLGSRAKMNITVNNSGTKEAKIFVQFVHPDTRAKVPITSFDIVEGDSSATATIVPGETREFIYYIKPSKISSYNLPLAALFFQNIFGEYETLLSNHPFMFVTEQKQIEVSLVLANEQEPKVFKAIIKNNFGEPFNGTITISPQTEFETYSQSVSILPNSEKEITFTAKPLDSGEYSFQTTIMDANQIYSSNQIAVEITQTRMSIQVLLAIIGIIIGAAIFGWIYFTKEK